MSGRRKIDKQRMALLARAYEMELRAASPGIPRVIQTRSKLAEALVTEGLLQHDTVVLGGQFPIEVSGYALTPLGRRTYCESQPGKDKRG